MTCTWGGQFNNAGGLGTNYIARYDMVLGSWHTLGNGLDRPVYALVVNGDDLVVGGDFTIAGGSAASRIARYDMVLGSWHALGSGLNGRALALVVNGDDLYVGGEFSSAGGLAASRIARYDMGLGSWHALGSGLNNWIQDFVVSGDDLYVGGAFTNAGGSGANYIARYDMGSGSWHALGSGVNSSVLGFAVNGTDLYVGGAFTSAGGKPASMLGRWSGLSSEQTYTLSIQGPNEGWHIMGAPVPAVTYGSLLNGIWTQGFTGSEYSVGTTNVIWYDESDRSTLWKTPGNASNIIGGGQDSGFDNLGKGFFAYVYADDDYDSDSDGWPKELSVTGIAPTSDITKSLSYTSAPSDVYTGWHLLSNPYPFTIDWSEVVADGSTTDINSTIFVWDPNRTGGADYLVSGSGGDYDGMIAPFQGFWVQATGGSAQVIFSPDHQASSESDYVKQKSEHLLTLSLENGDKSTWTSLVFDDEKAEHAEVYNAARMGSLDHDFMHLFTADSEGTPLIIQHLPLKIERSIELPLQVNTTQPGMYELNVQNMFVPNDISIRMVDRNTGKAVQVSDNLHYTFTVDPSEAAKHEVKSTEAVLSTSLLAERVQKEESRFVLQVSYGVENGKDDLPISFSLSQNYPNPFNPSTVINYQLPVSSEVQLIVFDMMGRQVARLVDGQVQAGTHQVMFDGSNLSSGIYIYRLKAGNQVFSRKLTVIK